MIARRLAPFLLALTACANRVDAPSPNASATSPLDVASAKYALVAASLDPAHGYPRATDSTGAWRQTPMNDWTSGFFAGTLWYLKQFEQAKRWTLPLADIPLRAFSHDLGFQFNSSFVNGYRFTGEEKYRATALNAARLLALRFNPVVGAIKSWDWMPASRPYPVIADNMMNLELLFWAGSQPDGDPQWREIAKQHALKTLANHVRADGSSYHVVVYDPKDGHVLERITHQGYADSSTWTRGQAWLIYGFTMTYRETGDPRFLDGARKVADYFVSHLPNDGVPCWDFQAPGCPETAKRDASAAAIAASGLIELSTYVSDGQRYHDVADHILETLSTPEYIGSTNIDAFLNHAVGNSPAGSEVDVGLSYGDYYFVEALRRMAEMHGDTTLHVWPARVPRTFTTRGEWLRENKESLRHGDPVLAASLRKLVADADSALKRGPFTVMAKERTPPSGDKHDYVSYAPYWWPDTTKSNGLPFIRRDGEVNQTTRRDSDVLRWYAMSDAVETLAHAFYFTERSEYAQRAAVLLRTWFLDPATRVNPNMNYGQAIPGVTEGRGIGLIDFRDFGRLLDAVTLLESSDVWTKEDDHAFRGWIDQYLEWLKTSKNGTDEAKEANNHGTWYDVQLGALQLFVGDTAGARALFEQAKTKRIASEIDSIGRQPLELARTRSLHYSVENLEGFTRMAEEARAVGVDLWRWQAPNGGSIAKAIEYVAPYADTSKAWPNQQITKEPEDLFVPLLLRARNVLDASKYAQYASRLPAGVLPGHRAHLLYPDPAPRACDVECLVSSQIIANGRRTTWRDTTSTVARTRQLMSVSHPDARIRNAVNGAVAWQRESTPYGLPDSPRLVAVLDTILAEHERWVKKNEITKSRNHETTQGAVVDAKYTGVEGANAMFRSILRALDFAPTDGSAYTIHIRNGRYNERVVVEKPNVSFIGENRDSTILSFDVAAGYRSPTGNVYGTRGSWVLRVSAPAFTLANMTVANTFDYPANYAKQNNDSTKLRDSQGLAVMLDKGNDRAVFKSCVLSGHQDTFFPDAGRTYVTTCTISGSVDFIFGAGRVVFDDVDIISRDRGSKSNNGYIAAPSTPESQPYGFLIINSRLKKETPAMAPNTVSLGRPWRPSSDPRALGSAVFINTWMDDHIGAKGWDSMNSFDAAGVRTTNMPEDSRFFEYHSSGPGAVSSSGRRVLTPHEASKYTIAKVLDGWNPK